VVAKKDASSARTTNRRSKRAGATRGARRSARSRAITYGDANALEIQIKVPVSTDLPATKRKLVAKSVQRYSETIGQEAKTLQELPGPALDEALRNAAEAAHAAIAERTQSEAPPELNARARQAMHETTRAMARIFADLAEQLSAAQLKEQMRVALDTTRAIVSGRPRVLDALTKVLREAGDLDEAGIESLNEAQLLALHNRVRQESRLGKDLRQWGLVRQRLHQLREENRVFAIKIPSERGLLYPEWQFDPETQRERDGVPELITAAKDLEIDPLSFHLLMTNPEAGGGTAPVEMLESGDVESAQAILRANAV
jgi:hypothetical protein